MYRVLCRATERSTMMQKQTLRTENKISKNAADNSKAFVFSNGAIQDKHFIYSIQNLLFS